jgi:carboxypeptidase PM20D1
MKNTKKLNKWVIALLSFLLILVILFSTIAVNTLLFKSRQLTVTKASNPVNADEVANRLSGALKFKTVSYEDQSKYDYQQFTLFQEYLEKTFPLVHAKLEKKLINKYSVLYIWKGSDANKEPALFIAHQDVVPAEKKGWAYDPFGGEIDDGWIYGRGTQDDKNCLMGLMEAVEYLLKQNYQPSRTIYLAFGHDEEIGGHEGAVKTAEYLKGQGIHFSFILDEGGDARKHEERNIPGEVAVARVGIAEKGYLSLELSATGEAGHSSYTLKETVIGILAAAIDKIQKNPFPARLEGATEQKYMYLGPEMSFPNNVVYANLWLTRPWVIQEMVKLGLTPQIQTIVAPTIFHSGDRDNVLPPRATAVINVRTMPGQSVDSVIQNFTKLINDTRVSIKPLSTPKEASRISSTSSAAYTALCKSIRETLPNTIAVPFLDIGATDAVWYSSLTTDTYRFVPVVLDSLSQGGWHHGVNERISVECYANMISCYIRIIPNSCN